VTTATTRTGARPRPSSRETTRRALQRLPHDRQGEVHARARCRRSVHDCHEPHQSDRPGCSRRPAPSFAPAAQRYGEAIAKSKHRTSLPCRSAGVPRPHGGQPGLPAHGPRQLCTSCHKDIQSSSRSGPSSTARSRSSRSARTVTTLTRRAAFVLKASSLKLWPELSQQGDRVDDKTTIRNIADVLTHAQFRHGPFARTTASPATTRMRP